MLITLQDLHNYGACYWDTDMYQDLRALCESMLPATPQYIAGLEVIPLNDRVFVLFRHEILTDPKACVAEIAALINADCVRDDLRAIHVLQLQVARALGPVRGWQAQLDIIRKYLP